MATRSETRASTYYNRLLDHLRMPLFRNGYALALSSAATSGIGLLYWILAAHAYPAEVVGINTAAIAAMMFLAGVSELNLMSALIRFIPTAGQSTRRFVIYSYLVSLVISAVISILFIKYLPILSPALKFLSDDPHIAVWFVVSTMAWCIFVLQDSVLTGLRQATWVPVENTIFSLAKIGLMLAFVGSIPSLGIFASWSLGLIFAIIPTNLYIFMRLIPNHMRADDTRKGHIEPAQVARYVAADYLGSLLWLVCTTLLPVIVATVAGAAANAAFYLSWTIVNTLYLISPNMGSSLVVEATKDQSKLGTYSYRVLINTLKLIVPAVVFLIIGAPYILMVFGKGYSSNGEDLLELLALSAIPNTINSIFISTARVQRRMRAVVFTLGSLSIMVLTLGYVLLKVYGVIGVGAAWLISQIVVAGIIFPTQLWPLWTAAENDGGISVMQSNIRTAKVWFIQSTYRIAKEIGLFSLRTTFKKFFSIRRKAAHAKEFLSIIPKELAEDLVSTCSDPWKIHHLTPTLTGLTVAFLGLDDQSPSMVLKISRDHSNAASLLKHSLNVSALHHIESLGKWRNLLPVILMKGVFADQFYFIERTIPGIEARRFLQRLEDRQKISSLAAFSIEVLHRQSARSQLVDGGMLQRWVHKPLSTIRNVLHSDGLEFPNTQKAIDRLAAELHTALAGKQVCISWVHGDYSPSNVLVDPDNCSITGIIDWDMAIPDGLPQLDMMHWVLSNRMAIEHKELGTIVRDLLLEESWTSDEQRIMDIGLCGLPGSPIDLRSMLLLAWLCHIHANLTKTSQFNHHYLWEVENILPVLQVL